MSAITGAESKKSDYLHEEIILNISGISLHILCDNLYSVKDFDLRMK